MNIIHRVSAMLLGCLFVVGCSTSSNVLGVSQMSNHEYLLASNDVRQQYRSDLAAASELLNDKWMVELKAGMPVKWDFGDNDYLLKCQWMPNKDYRQLVLREGSDPASWDRNASQTELILAANGGCEAQLKVDGDLKLPIVLYKHHSVSQGAIRALVERTVPAMAANTGAALIAKDGRCKDNCGSTYNLHGGQGGAGGTAVSGSSSAAIAEVDTNTTVDITGGCPSGDCGSVFHGLPTSEDGVE